MKAHNWRWWQTSLLTWPDCAIMFGFMSARIKQIDFILIYHCKEAYLPDLWWLLDELDILTPGHFMFIADNTINPGNPEYFDWVQASPEPKGEIVKISTSAVGP
ncbi:hypothetical protein N7476_006384 [Penicillium atrosanguineum]|uniref:Uncharacterized protein n=1 Tax=Penicillium atrosanguineum TaxID=1132637 RepID=A0A9W9PX22_9EURO|nr:hypothetical protein N7526_011215 [Penicillium atrosanguineum]KAJ5316077.1 hypothetical protein N7476_006384 [Penicillium atrosanguineum]